MGKVLWNKETGEAKEYEGVDAREILERSPELYTDVDPSGEPLIVPQNEADVHDEFMREPVGDDPPKAGEETPVIRNPVTDKPQMAEPAAGDKTGGVNASAERAEAEKPADPLDHDSDGKKGGSLPKADKK